jgi:hypothetical protein
MPRASQIDIETVREVLAVLGISGGGGGPDLSAQVAALEADVAALQAADADFSARIIDVEDLVGALQTQNIPFAWVVFDGTTEPDPTILNGFAAGGVARLAPGVYRFSLGEDFGDTNYAAVFGASGSAVQEVGTRTSNTIDVETTEGEVSAFVSIVLFGTLPPEPS